jgi:hypothetical protein
MVLKHLAAIFFFSGLVFYIGSLMVFDPAGFASVPKLFAWALRNFERALSGLPPQKRLVDAEQGESSRRLRTPGGSLVWQSSPVAC